jgi:hypothetical protein
MLKARELRDTHRLTWFAVSLTLGMVLTFIAQRFGVPAAFLSLLLIPLAVFAVPAAIRQAMGLSRALRVRLAWWHGLWLLLLLSGLIFRVRTSEAIEDAPVDTWAAYRITLVGIVALCLGVRLALRRTAWVGSLFRGLPGVLAAYVLVSVASTTWSAYPAWTLYRSLEYGVDVALLAAILATVESAKAYRTLFDWTWALYLLLVSSIWVGVLVWPGEALQPIRGLIGIDLTGVLPAIHENTVGELGAVVAVVALARLLLTSGDPPNRTFYSLLLPAGLVTLVLSQTRSALAGFLLGAGLLLFLAKKITLWVSAIIASLVILASRAGDLLGAYFLRGQTPELFASLSGRVGYWEAGWQAFLKSPLTGLGAYTARFEVLARIGESERSHIHNTYLEVLVGTSFWGLAPVVVALIATWWILIGCVRNYPPDSCERRMALEAVAVLAVVSVRSLFTSHLIAHPSLSFLLVVGYAEFLRRHKSQRRPNCGWILTVNQP